MELSGDHLTLCKSRLAGVEVLEFSGRGFLYLIMKGGAGVYRCGSLLIRLGPGDILVVNNGSQGRIEPKNGHDMVFWTFVAEFEHLFPLFSGREVCLLQNVVQVFKNGRVYSGSSNLAKECLKLVEDVPGQSSLDHRSHVLRIVSAILSTEFKAAQPTLADQVPMRDHVVQVFDRLQTNDLLTLSVGELAKKFSCSRRHLNRLFHQHFGVSVATMRMEMRLLKAVSLLVDPDAKITYIAEKCGFNHLGLFNTCFKKRFGASPSQLRKIVTQTKHQPPKAERAGCPFQIRGEHSEKPNPGVQGSNGTRPYGPSELVPVCGLLREIATGKNVVARAVFARTPVPNSAAPSRAIESTVQAGTQQ